MRFRHVILLFGLVNACLFSALQPLWEGFDEPFHYAYVETLWQTHHFPVLGRTLVSKDVAQSFRLAPVSHVVHRWITEATSFDDWFRLPAEERISRRNQLDSIRAEPGDSTRPNYEAHHPPLAFLALAALDRPLSNASLTTRVLTLRLFAACCAILLLFFGTVSLCRTLELPEPFADAALFTIICSEMLYATVAHVANDWLAVGLSAVFLAALASLVKTPSQRAATVTALALTAGLLTKAYFLVFALLAIGVAAVLLSQRRISPKALLPAAALLLALAAPWYARNIALYGNVSGTHEQFDGIGFKQAIAVVPRIDWAATTVFLARSSLWTGNNSFTSFSRGTLTVVLALLLLGVGAWAADRERIQRPEYVIMAAILLFSLAVAYATCASFADKNGDVPGASPWYTQVLLAPVVALAYLGLSRWKRWGTYAAMCAIAVWTWILIATWVVKLFPMYSGAGAAPMRIRDVWNWYLHGAAAHTQDLSLLALAPAPVLYLGLLASVTLALFLSATTIRRLVAVRNAGDSPVPLP